MFSRARCFWFSALFAFSISSRVLILFSYSLHSLSYFFSFYLVTMCSPLSSVYFLLLAENSSLWFFSLTSSSLLQFSLAFFKFYLISAMSLSYLKILIDSSWTRSSVSKFILVISSFCWVSYWILSSSYFWLLAHYSRSFKFLFFSSVSLASFYFNIIWFFFYISPILLIDSFFSLIASMSSISASFSLSSSRFVWSLKIVSFTSPFLLTILSLEPKC